MAELAIRTADDLTRLIDDGVREGRSMDYKASAVGGADEDKREFLADVTSFANSAGGHLILGIREADGVPVELVGIGQVDLDTEILRLENLIRDGVSPRLVGVEMQPVSLDNRNAALSIHIPRSWALPHIVIYKNLSRFYSRNSAGKYQLDVGELRGLFEISGSAAERARGFRAERISLILNEELPVRLEPVPKVVLHIVPYDAFSTGAHHDLGGVGRGLMPKPIDSGVTDSRHNFDGYLAYGRSPNLPSVHSYVQLFRNGCLEAVEAGMLSSDGDNTRIPYIALIEKVLEALAGYIGELSSLGVRPPLAVMLSLLDVEGYEIRDESRTRPRTTSPAIDRRNLLFPEVVLQSLDFGHGRFIRPVFDALWNAAGWPRCWCFDDNDIYKKPK